MPIANRLFVVLHALCLLPVCACEKSSVRRLTTTSPASAARSSYIGYEYEDVSANDTLPNGVLKSGGALIGDPGKASYGLSLVSRGTAKMLWLEHLAGGTNRHFRWRVDAVLDLPVLPHGDDLVWGASCAVNGTNDPEIIAVVVATDTERYTQIVRAWRADRQHHSFRDVDTRGITCENAGYGADG